MRLPVKGKAWSNEPSDEWLKAWAPEKLEERKKKEGEGSNISRFTATKAYAAGCDFAGSAPRVRRALQRWFLV